MALIVTRQIDQGVIVCTPDGQRIRIFIANITQQVGRWPQVKLGIDAPRDWNIYREELPQPHRATA